LQPRILARAAWAACLVLLAGGLAGCSLLDLVGVGFSDVGGDDAQVVPGEQPAQPGDSEVEIPSDSGAKPLTGFYLIIDAGHGGRVGEGNNVLGNTGWLGQTGPEDGIYEKDITLIIAHKVAAVAEKAGAKVYMTRTGDYPVLNRERGRAASAWAQAQGATAENCALVSIHTNSRGTIQANGKVIYDAAMHGTQVIWPLSQVGRGRRSDGSDRLALVLKDEFVRRMHTIDRGGWGQNLDVLYYTEYPAVLLELMFQSNRAEEQRLLNYDEQWHMAEAIVAGLRRWWDR
jgi:N-acetylmuramoyl-L-alanine amidase